MSYRKCLGFLQLNYH